MGMFDNVSWGKPLGDAGTGVSWKNPFGQSAIGNYINEQEKNANITGPGQTQQDIADTFTTGKGTWGGKSGEKGSKGAIRASLALTGPGLSGLIDQPAFDWVGKAADRWGGGGALGRMVGLNDGSAGQTPKYENPYENLPAFDPSAYQKGGFNTSEMSKSMQRDNAVRQSRDQANAVAQMNQYGTLSSGQSNAAMGNLAAEGERSQQGIQAQLARMSYEDALKRWMIEREQLANTVNSRNKQKQADYEDKRAREMQDESNLGNVAGMVGSYFMGGKKPAVAK